MSSESFNEDINDAIEGEEDSPEVSIDVSESAVRPEVWKDTESLLYRGFLAARGSVNGVSLIFKSLNHHEFQHIQWISGDEQQERFYNTFLAYGVFMVEGESVLANRQEMIPYLRDNFFAILPMPAKTRLVRYLSEINRRATNAVTLTEAYVLEKSSRFRWAQLQGIDLMSPTCTGVVGTETLGLNYAQLVWRALNHFDDMREMAEREWDNAKFIGSCSAGKEIQKIYNQDRTRRRKEKEAREERKDRLLRQVLLGESPDEAGHQGEVHLVARSVEELAKQLQSSLRGEKDWHDLVVEAEEKRMREQVEEQRSRVNTIFEQRVKEEGSRDVTAQSLMSQGYTLQQVEQHIQRRKALAGQKMASRVVVDDSKFERVIDKYGTASQGTYAKPQGEPFAGTDKDTSTALPVGVSRPSPNPFRR